MISDLDSNLDKARVSSVVKSEDDAHNFQQELNNVIYPWATTNKAVFNGDKFEHIHFGNNLHNPHPITTTMVPLS